VSAPPGSARPPSYGSAPRGPPPERRSFGEDRRGSGTPRKRMMAQGRKGHFMHDAKALLARTEGGMDDQHVRAFLEGIFARGARHSTADAQEFLDEKLQGGTITPEQRQGLGRLVEQYSFWR
jgi:hypothetical protein